MFRSLFYLLMLFFVLTPNSNVLANEKIKIGFVYVSPVGEEGWSYQHDIARKQLAMDPNVETFYVENITTGADAERVILNMARKNYDIIFSTSFTFMDSTLKVAKQFPNINFLHCAGYKTSANVSTYFGRMYQARYLSGMLAGKMTKSNIIGYVAAFPIPEVIRGINAFTLGVREVNPNAEVRVVWTKTWYDQLTEKESAKSLLDVGADIISQHQDSAGPQLAAEERGKYSIGYNTDMSKIAPNAQLAAIVWNWVPFYDEVVKKVVDKSWKSGDYWPGLEKGTVDITAFNKVVPDDVKVLILNRKQEIIDGTYVVFQGVVKDQLGNVKVKENESLSDKELLEMNWFVEGVVGSLE